MKKSFVFLLLALALVVLVSPGIVGRLAEQSMDENLEWAATESQELTITSQGFDRGWFSSAGQHRIDLKAGDVRDALLVFAMDAGFDDLPALIIDTQIDHGLVPVTSMSREQGSLAPGLGSAVSTLRLEFPGGDTIDLPGTIYSKVSLAGELQSNLILEPGTFSDRGETLAWSDVDVRVNLSPTDSAVGFSGGVSQLILSSPGSEITIDNFGFDGRQQQTRFGLAIGDAALSIDAVTMPAAWGTDTFGPVNVTSTAGISDDLLSGRTTVALEDIPFAEFGRANIDFDVSIDGVDAQAVSNLSQLFDAPAGYGSGDAMMRAAEDDINQLLARGFQLRVDRLDIETAPGTLSATFRADVAPSQSNGFAWVSALLALDAELTLSLPVELYDLAVSLDPQVGAAAGLGFLRREGDMYEMKAEFSDGMLTVNGAPMPGLVPGLN